MLKFTVNSQSLTNIVSFKCLSSSLSSACDHFVTYFAMAFDIIKQKGIGNGLVFHTDKVVLLNMLNKSLKL